MAKKNFLLYRVLSLFGRLKEGLSSIKIEDFFQYCQLTLLYTIALADFTHSFLTVILTLGYTPEILQPALPFIKRALNSRILKLWISPERMFMMSYFAIDLMVIKSKLKLSKLVRYNILLLFSILMFQGILSGYWDFFFNRDILTQALKYRPNSKPAVLHNTAALSKLYLNLFISFLCIYFYLYMQAVQGKFFTFPGMSWFTDSLAFWLRIKTPSMEVGE
jgi:hypothetical protein